MNGDLIADKVVSSSKGGPNSITSASLEAIQELDVDIEDPVKKSAKKTEEKVLQSVYDI